MKGQNMVSEIKSFAPVIIPTLNRYEHFKRCVDSLSRCTHADKTELVIGLDYPPSEKYVEGYNKIKDYISKIEGFGKLTVFYRETNYGSSKNNKALREYVETQYDYFIGLEDDCEVSSAFLDYMNKALVQYKDAENVTSVGGYLPLCSYGLSESVVFSWCVYSWGIGRWIEKDHKYLQTPNSYYFDIINNPFKAFKLLVTAPAYWELLYLMTRRKASYGDVKRSMINLFEKKYQVRPCVSLVRNLGHDGSGMHGGLFEDDFYAKQKIFEGDLYDKELSGKVENTIPRSVYFNHFLEGNRKAKIRTLWGYLLGYTKTLFIKVKA